MWTVFKHTFLEALHRRMALVILVAGFLGAVVPYLFTFEKTPDGAVYVTQTGSTVKMHARDFVNDQGQNNLVLTQRIWIYLGLFAIAPLMTSYLGRGDAEMLFTKGVTREGIFTARFLGSYGVFVLSLVFFCGINALWLWLNTDLSMRSLLVAVAIEALGFLSIMSLMAVVSLFQPQPASIIAFGFMGYMLSTGLADRAAMYKLLHWLWVQKLIDFLYYIFPKTNELSSIGLRYFVLGTITNWMPIWSTALFIVVMFAGCLALIRSKSF